MKRISSLLVAGAFLLIAPSLIMAGGRVESAEPPGASAPERKTFTDASGTAVTLPEEPRRIASSALMSDEILWNILPAERIAALSVMAWDDQLSNIAGELIPREALEETSGMQALTLNPEVIIALNPDVLFTAIWADGDAVRQIRQAGVPVFLLDVPVTLEGALATVDLMGRVLGVEETASDYRSTVEEKADRLATLRKAIPEEEKALVMEYTPWGTAGGSGSSWDHMIALAGCRNAVGHREADQWGNVPLSRELLISLDPDYLVLPAWVYQDPDGPRKLRESLHNDPALQGLTAIEKNQLIQIPEAHKSATSPYLLEGALDLAQAVYPQLYDEIITSEN